MPCCWASPPPSLPNIPPPPRIMVSLRCAPLVVSSFSASAAESMIAAVVVHHPAPAPSALALGSLTGRIASSVVLGPELAVDGLEQEPLVGDPDHRGVAAERALLGGEAPAAQLLAVAEQRLQRAGARLGRVLGHGTRAWHANMWDATANDPEEQP